MIIQYGNQVFNDDIPDDNGTVWYVTALEGWDSPELRQSAAEPTSRHGNVMAKALLAPRAMTMTGIVKSPSEEAHWAAWKRLQEVTNNIFQTRPFRVSEDMVREVQVIRAGGVRQRLLGNYAFEFEVPMTAPDPLKYPTSPTSTMINPGATSNITNIGNFPTERYTMTVRADGGVALTNTTISLQALTITSDDVLVGTVINALERSIYDSEDHPIPATLHAISTWWPLLPGSNAVRNIGTARVELTYYPAWL